MSDGGETNEEKISKQADILAEQVPKAFNIKVILVMDGKTRKYETKGAYRAKAYHTT